MKKVLTIAGSDCSGGAGIQADLKTFTSYGLYGMSVITALTAQNTTGVFAIVEVDPGFVGKQMDAIFSDICPDAVKIGMTSSSPLIEIIAKKLIEYKAVNIVVDPVMVSTSGSRLLKEDALSSLKRNLLPLANVITPNIPEAEILSGIEICNKDTMRNAAQIIAKTGEMYVLLKGGHFENSADDLLIAPDGAEKWFLSERVDNPNTHGTGCTLSSAIACGLALELSVEESVASAKEYVTEAIKRFLDLGNGRGPLDHCGRIRREINT